jgi:CspA family cold shock protein
MTGTIKNIKSDKGFGFIESTDGTEYFFHRSAVAANGFDTLKQHQPVTFEPGDGPKGPRAEHVRPA